MKWNRKRLILTVGVCFFFLLFLDATCRGRTGGCWASSWIGITTRCSWRSPAVWSACRWAAAPTTAPARSESPVEQSFFFFSCLPQWGVSQLDDWPITWLATARKRWIAPQGSWVRWGGWPDKTRGRNTSDSCRKEFRISPGCWRPRGRPKPTIWPGNIRQEELEDVSFTSHRLNPNVQSYLLWLQHVYELCHFFLLTTGGKKHPRHVQLAIKSGKSGPHEDSLKVCFRVLVDWMNSGGFGLRSELQNSWERARKVCKSNDVRTFGFSPATWTQIRFSSKRSGCSRREIFWKMTLLINRLIRFI